MALLSNCIKTLESTDIVLTTSVRVDIVSEFIDEAQNLCTEVLSFENNFAVKESKY